MRNRCQILTMFLLASQTAVLASALAAAEPQSELKVRISWGYQSGDPAAFYVQLLAEAAEIAEISGRAMEAEDHVEDTTWQTRAGGGDVDGLEFTLRYSETPVEKIKNLHSIWSYLLEHSDLDTARRLRLDPAYRRDPRKLTVRMDRDGTKGFSVTIDQLVQNKAFWVPSLDIYVTAGASSVSFADHIEQLEPWKGRRILGRVRDEPEATYAQYTARWEDMANPSYKNPAQQGPGHIVGLAWDSSIHKFGVDRGAGAWNDLGYPDKFHFWFDFGDPSRAIVESWQGQQLTDGLPVVTTVFEKDGVRYEVEQFAYPLNGPPEVRRGDIAMVLLHKVTVTNLNEWAREISIFANHQRERSVSGELETVRLREYGASVLEDSASHNTFFSIEGRDIRVCDVNQPTSGTGQKNRKNAGTLVSRSEISFDLAANGSREFVVKLPSPPVPSDAREDLLRLEYTKARSETLKFWSEYLARGAQFSVPEKAVNDLFRANLWHALRLPRRHGSRGRNVKIDLPYSNFAYGQDGTPWPVNQAVYVDYMVYDLRGYHDLSVEELLTIYRSNQEANGHVGGYADWGVYTPSMIYVVAKNYRLSGDRDALDSLLPQTLKALDWCLAEIQRNSERAGPSGGLVRSPLNDLTGDGIWAFTQAYMAAGLELFGQVLREIDHPRAQECLTAAHTFRKAVARSFKAASVRSPLVQLRDHTWIPYVPCEASASGRLLTQWYPTDVDTGAVHLLRLKALPATSALADYLLNDHEDNLFLHGWGMANEPVYNQQATAYLLRDEPKAAIRAFYSYMACAFSHSAFEPVEHRWAWGQYFGPPSTDGAWFELYRNMLIHELDNDTLLLLQATPRKWLEDGKAIEVRRAPTYYGRLTMSVASQAASNRLLAEIEMPDRSRPELLLVRLRHPIGKPIKSVTINGRNWTDFDVQKEWVRIERPEKDSYSIVVHY